MLRLRTFAALAVALAAVGCTPDASGAYDGEPLRPVAALPDPEPAGDQMVWTTSSDARTVTSVWHLLLAGDAVDLTLVGDAVLGRFKGSARGSDGHVDAVDNVTWDPVGGVLTLRRVGRGYWQWLHARAVEGVLVGRASFSTVDGNPPGDVSALATHVTGWSEAYFGGDVVPRAYELTAGGRHARLQLDRDATGALVGRLKLYATDDDGWPAEEIERDVDVEHWDGATLSLVRHGDDGDDTWSATATGATLSGNVTDPDGTVTPLSGVRVELAGGGLLPVDATTRAAWQTRARRQLAHLMMGDNPAPASVAVTRRPLGPAPPGAAWADGRDDDPDAHPASYSVDELTLQLTVASPWGLPPMARTIHGYVATPAGPPPPGGWPAMIALNGHDGSAAATLDPAGRMYWYGDAWARRGWLVVAVDIGHRPVADRGGLYSDYETGDAPGNGPHPALASGGLDSDWEENGERAWDVLRALDWLLAQPGVDRARVGVTGLSLGGEIATLAGALDPRFTVVATAGYAPFLPILAWYGNHPCWLWTHGDPRDWYAVADLHALVAPRALVVEVGAKDDTFSPLDPPFVDAREVLRRSRAAFADAPGQLVTYLHDAGHAYRFGDVAPADDDESALGVLVPAIDGPRFAGDAAWASDPATAALGRTLPDELDALLGR